MEEPCGSNDKLDFILVQFCNAKTDEQRFALLMLLAKLAPEPNATSQDASTATTTSSDPPGLTWAEYGQKVYDAIGIRFIKRLLLSKKVPAGCPPDIYRSLALSILSGFAAIPSIAAEPVVLELADFVCDVLEPATPISDEDEGSEPSNPPDVAIENLPENATETQYDAIQVLAGIATIAVGRACLLRRGVDRVLSEYIVARVPSKAVVLAIQVLVRLVEDADGSGVLCGSARTVSAVDAIATCMALREDSVKLMACQTLVQLLEVIRGSYSSSSATVVAVSTKGTWPHAVAFGVWALLRNRLGAVERDFVLQLAAVTSELRGGVGWAVNPDVDLIFPNTTEEKDNNADTNNNNSNNNNNTTTTTNDNGNGNGNSNNTNDNGNNSNTTNNNITNSNTTATDTDTDSNNVTNNTKKLPKADDVVLLLTQLVCVELRMALEDRSIEEVEKMGQRVASCYVVVEHTIVELTSSDKTTVSFESASVGKLHAALSDSVNAILALLLTLQVEGVELPAPATSETNPKEALLLSSVRVLSVWLAEETTLTNEICGALAYIVALLRRQQQQQQQQQQHRGTATPDPLRWLLPGLCHLTADDLGRTTFLNAGGHVLLAECLTHTWIPQALAPHTMTNVDADDEADDDTGVGVGVGVGGDNNVQLLQSAITACGALLNVVVLAPAVVESDPAFAKIGSMFSKLLVRGPVRWGGHTCLLFANMAVVLLRIRLARPHDADASTEVTVHVTQWQTLLQTLTPFLIWTATTRSDVDDVALADDKDEVEMLQGLAIQALHAALGRKHRGLVEALGVNKKTQTNISEDQLVNVLSLLKL